MKNELELYIHIPFCVKKCAYCDFLSAPGTANIQEEYMKALQKEIIAYSQEMKEYVVTSIFLGGGTPSIIASRLMNALFDTLHEAFVIEEGAEITIEVNPGTVVKEKLDTYHAIGINRISIGLQSTNNEELQCLGRIHTFEEFLATYKAARSAGFNNINVDLISAVPGQTCESWRHTLQTVAKLQPEHISAYSLIIEEGTPFYERYNINSEVKYPSLPTEETDRQMYEDTQLMLKEYGYHRYEISNYAKEGYECKHNIGYWKRKEYLGLGIGSASLLNHTRFSKLTSIKEYLNKSTYMELEMFKEAVTVNRERLSLREETEEYIFLGLRMVEGIILTPELLENYKDIIVKYEKEEMLEIVKEKQVDCISQKYQYPRLKLTDKGISVSNYILAEFL